MNKHSQQIKDIIEYLVKVYNNEDVGRISQNFFKSIPDLDKLLNNYFLQFENNDEQNKAIAHNLEILNNLSSFPVALFSIIISVFGNFLLKFLWLIFK